MTDLTLEIRDTLKTENNTTHPTLYRFADAEYTFKSDKVTKDELENALASAMLTVLGSPENLSKIDDCVLLLQCKLKKPDGNEAVLIVEATKTGAGIAYTYYAKSPETMERHFFGKEKDFTSYVAINHPIRPYTHEDAAQALIKLWDKPAPAFTPTVAATFSHEVSTGENEKQVDWNTSAKQWGTDYKGAAQWAAASFVLFVVTVILIDQAYDFIPDIDWSDYLDPLNIGTNKDTSVTSKAALTLFAGATTVGTGATAYMAKVETENAGLERANNKLN